MIKRVQENPAIVYILLAAVQIPLWFLLLEGRLTAATVGAVVLIVVTANLLSRYRGRKADSLFVTDLAKRNAVYDWIRLAAMCLVIITHAVQYFLMAGYGTDHLNAYRIVYLLAFACNPLFLMLTGALVLPRKDISLWKFYTRKIPKILIPLVVYLFLIQWKYGQLNKQDLFGSAWANIRSLYTGEETYMPILTFMTIVLGIYLLIPFLSRLVQALSFTQLSVLLLMCLGSDIIKHFFSIQPIARFMFSGYVGVCMMGYWLTRPEAEHYRWLIRIMSLISAAVLLYWVYYDLDFYAITTDSPVLYIIAAEIFNAIYYRPKLFRSWYPAALFSKYSFSILLIHRQVIASWLEPWGIRTDLYGGFGILPALTVTAVLSLLEAFAIDNSLVYIVQECYGCILTKLEKSRSR